MHLETNPLVDSENDDTCTESSDGKQTYSWINKHTRRRGSEHTLWLETISACSIRWMSSVPSYTASKQDTEWLPHGYWRSLEWDTERLRYGYRIGPERDWIWPPNVLSSLPNGVTRESHVNYQEMITDISLQRISLLNDFTLRSRGFPGALPYQATDRDAYGMAYQRIKSIAERHIELNAKPPY